MNPEVLVGLFVGGMAAFVFCSFTMRAVGRAAGAIVENVRSQFLGNSEILAGTAEPDYESCVRISTRSAQREMIAPAQLGVACAAGRRTRSGGSPA